MADSQEDVRAAVLARYRQLCADHAQAQVNVDVVQAHQRELMAQINDCFSAARLFGFDLMAEFQGGPRQDTLGTDCGTCPIVPNRAPVLSAPPVKSGPSVKELVLEAAETAYPLPVRAIDVRRDLAALGYLIHEKTVGMTLYRWSVKGCTRRVDRNWYFVPPEQRHQAEANGDHHNMDSALELAAPLAS